VGETARSARPGRNLPFPRVAPFLWPGRNQLGGVGDSHDFRAAGTGRLFLSFSLTTGRPGGLAAFARATQLRANILLTRTLVADRIRGYVLRSTSPRSFLFSDDSFAGLICLLVPAGVITAAESGNRLQPGAGRCSRRSFAVDYIDLPRLARDCPTPCQNWLEANRRIEEFLESGRSSRGN